MAPLKLLVVAVLAGVAGAFAPVNSGARQATQLQETFGLGLGEDTYENQPDLLKGEQEYKQYMNRVKADNMLNRKVSHLLSSRRTNSTLAVLTNIVVGLHKCNFVVSI